MPEQLIAGYKRFREGYFRQNEESLISLAEGQSPDFAVLSCCDSRVDPAIIFDTDPGELFFIRNVANLVPEYENDGRPRGTSSALEFAVTGLNVSHIIVLGHARCGGIKALMDRRSSHEPRSFVDQWMKIAESVKQEVLTRDISVEEQYTICEQATIVMSLRNLLSFPWINERAKKGEISLHGWYYDLNEGTLSCYDQEMEKFEQVPCD